MQNKILEVNETTFDKELCCWNSYGKSVIICNFNTYKILHNWNWNCIEPIDKNKLNYKGHKVYIDLNFNDFEYLIIPNITNSRRLKDLEDIWRKENENAE